MLDSGTNVIVIPLIKVMTEEQTMCFLVGYNKAEGLIVSQLCTERRPYLV